MPVEVESFRELVATLRALDHLGTADVVVRDRDGAISTMMEMGCRLALHAPAKLMVWPAWLPFPPESVCGLRTWPRTEQQEQ